MASSEDSSFKYPEMILAERLQNLLMEPPTFELSEHSPYDDYSVRNSSTLRPFVFLSLPPEIRNNIYRHLLIHRKPVKLGPSFRIGDTNLLCTNRQIYEEAREMFYHENVFAIPEAVFHGNLFILDALEGPLYRLPRSRLASLQRLEVNVPVFGPGSHESLREQVVTNLLMLLIFLQLSPGGTIRVTIKYEIVRGVDDSSVTHDLLQPLLVQPDILFFKKERSRVKIHVNIKVHPKELITTKTLLALLKHYDSFAHTYVLLGDLLPGMFGSGSEMYRRAWVKKYLRLWSYFEPYDDVLIQEIDFCSVEVPMAFYTQPENQWLQ